MFIIDRPIVYPIVVSWLNTSCCWIAPEWQLQQTASQIAWIVEQRQVSFVRLLVMHDC